MNGIDSSAKLETEENAMVSPLNAMPSLPSEAPSLPQAPSAVPGDPQFPTENQTGPSEFSEIARSPSHQACEQAVENKPNFSI
jgi:hypothetical protein